jgi:hypothetical protein
MNSQHAVFDEQLDRALASYTPAATRPGLEQRLLAGLAAEPGLPARRSLPAFGWAWAGAAAIAAALLLAVLLRPPAPLAPSSNLAGVSAVEQPAAALPSPQSVRRPRRIVALPLPVTLPQPTQQELIAQLLANAPETIASLAKAAELQDRPLAIEPLPADSLAIEPIQIAPIEDNPAEAGVRF